MSDGIELNRQAATRKILGVREDVDSVRLLVIGLSMDVRSTRTQK